MNITRPLCPGQPIPQALSRTIVRVTRQTLQTPCPVSELFLPAEQFFFQFLISFLRIFRNFSSRFAHFFRFNFIYYSTDRTVLSTEFLTDRPTNRSTNPFCRRQRHRPALSLTLSLPPSIYGAAQAQLMYLNFGRFFGREADQVEVGVHCFG